MSKQRTAACLLALLMSCNTSWSSTPQSGVRFKLIRESVITVRVLVNGRGPFDFVFDTGTESSLIDSRLAGELKISPVDRVLLSNPGGEKALLRGFADEISLGSMNVLHSEVIIGDLAGLHALNPHIRGIIGQNVLSHFDYVIDYAHSLIRIASDSNPEETIQGTKMEMVRRHGCPIIVGRINKKSDLQLSLDSGSSHLVLYRSTVPASSRMVTAQMQSSSEAVETGTVAVPQLELGDVSLWGLQTALVNKPQIQDIDGLIPTRLFSAVFVNNSQGYVIVRKR